MIISSDTVQHELTIPHLNTIGLVDEYKDVVYEAVLYINSSSTFDHTYTTKQIRYPQQTGTETQIVEEVEYTEGILSFPPQASLIKEDGIAYYEYPKTEVGIVVEKEIEVPVYDIPAEIEEEVEITEEKTVTEFTGFSIQLPTNNIENFVPFEELSEELVLSWIPDNVIESYLAQHENALLKKQDEILNPIKYKKDTQIPPWKGTVLPE